MTNEQQEKKIKVDGTEVKVKGAPPAKGIERPKYYCQECNLSFPGPLDLEAHQKIDHAKKVSVA